MASAERIVAVVTGSSRGVGKGVALALGGKGWRIRAYFSKKCERRP
jgi:NAD(P)-dependent dehydrogenase (short-subunit alcohol dehydrogenase family)